MPMTLTASGNAAATAYGTLTVGTTTFVGTIAPQSTAMVLASGNNTFAVPAGSVGVFVTPSTLNTQALLAKTTIGDTGVPIPKTTPSVFIFDQSALPANFYINAAALSVGSSTVLFF